MNASGKRDPLDRWYTPQDAANAVVRHVAGLGRALGSSPTVIVPGCGGGAFLRAIDTVWPSRSDVWACDPDPAAHPDSATARWQDVAGAVPRHAIVITNPPFSEAAEFVDVAFDVALAAEVHLLLPFSFRGGGGRLALWRRLSVIGLMHPRITYGGPARDAKIAAAEAAGKKFADSSNGDSAVFSWYRDHSGPTRIVDVEAWR